MGEPRRPPFAWRGRLTQLQRCFPQLEPVDLDTWYRGINRVAPGLIRVDADEVTYSLHIILRFELEQELVSSSLALADFEAWNAKMAELLGVDVPDDARGVLQDVHWTRAAYGYFPTYALGNARCKSGTPSRRSCRIQRSSRQASSACSTSRCDVASTGTAASSHRATLERAIGASEIDPRPYLAYLRSKVAGLQPA